MAKALRRPVSLPGSGRQKRLSFALTPLADAMFQLLIFFMLSSSLAPYSLITLKAAAAPVEAEAVVPQLAPATPVIWQIVQGGVRVGQEVVPMDEVADRALAFAQGGGDALVVFVGRAATVQDVATVTEALTLARISRVQLVARAGG